MLDLYEEFNGLIRSLTERGIDYAVCGALALAVHGLPRATVDIDLMILADDLEEALTAAHDQGYTIPSQPMTFADGAIEIHRRSKPDPDLGDVLILDLLLVTPAIAEVWEDRQEVEWEEGRLRVISRAGLIALKSLRASSQDVADIERLKE